MSTLGAIRSKSRADAIHPIRAAGVIGHRKWMNEGMTLDRMVINVQHCSLIDIQLSTFSLFIITKLSDETDVQRM